MSEDDSLMVAFASEGESLDSMLSQHFGRCPYFVFVELKGKEIGGVKALKNPFFENHEPGVVPKFIYDNKAKVIISGSMGPSAINVFKNLGITAYTVFPKRIRDVLSDFLEGKFDGSQPEHRHYD